MELIRANQTYEFIFLLFLGGCAAFFAGKTDLYNADTIVEKGSNGKISGALLRGIWGEGEMLTIWYIVRYNIQQIAFSL